MEISACAPFLGVVWLGKVTLSPLGLCLYPRVHHSCLPLLRPSSCFLTIVVVVAVRLLFSISPFVLVPPYSAFVARLLLLPSLVRWLCVVIPR